MPSPASKGEAGRGQGAMTSAAIDRPTTRRGIGLALIAPALAVVGLFFVAPLVMSAVVAFRGKNGGFTLEHFAKSFEYYTTDLLFTLAIVVISTLLIGAVAIAIAGYLTLGEHPRTVAILRWLYRWPLFIPFVVAGQLMRTFLAKSGMLNHVLIASGLIEPLSAQSLLDWRGIVVAFVWKQAPFVTLLLAGAVASLEAQHIEAARNLGARRLRVLVDIVLPQVRGTLLVGLVLSFAPMLCRRPSIRSSGRWCWRSSPSRSSAPCSICCSGPSRSAGIFPTSYRPN